ncbi:MAG: DUF5655 domain-containing protein [Anaerolineaceae bacterium]|nr:DUF5655 domain-containing protein [Anaerolineaceae bacterium]
MSGIDQAFETQIANLQKRSGKTMDELFDIIRKSNLTKHGEIREMLKKDLGMGHGDANTLVHVFLDTLQMNAVASPNFVEENLNEIYSGSKLSLRPLHDAVMKAIQELGDFEIAPKKTYLSLRRKRQFAMVGPGSKGRLEVGLNMKGLSATERLVELPPGGMCQYKVYLTELNEVDSELVNWVKSAYELAG